MQLCCSERENGIMKTWSIWLLVSLCALAVTAVPALGVVYSEPHLLLVGDTYRLPIDGYTGDLYTTSPKTDANDGLNGDCIYFQRYRVTYGHDSGNCKYWCSSANDGYPGIKWVDYKPPLSVLNPGRYKLTAKYRCTLENRAPYPALYIVTHLGGTTTIEKSQREGTDGDCIYFDLGEFDLGTTGWVRVKDDPGTSSLTWNPMDFKYLGPSSTDTQAPSVPTGVTATAQSSTSILVTWTASTDNVGVAGYKVFRNGTQVGTPATTSYTDTGLIPVTTYSYTVSAYDAAGNNSAQSSPAVTATTLTGPPVITQQPQPQSVCPTATATFTVAAVGGTISYLWQKNNSDLSNGGHYSNVTTATLTVSNVDSGDAASYRCVVSNSYGSSTSNSASLTVMDCSGMSVSPDGHWIVFRGKKTLLIGDSVTQGWMECGTNFNQTGYVDALASRGINMLMIWSYIGITDQVGDTRIGYDAPEIWPWVKTGSQFNLDSLNDAYFDRLRLLAQHCNEHGIAFLITIHDGWTKTRFPGHPFNTALGGPLSANTQYVELSDYNNEMPTTYNSGWTRQQKTQYFMEKYCNRLIQATSDQTNVIYEMFNEGEWYNQTNLGNFEKHFVNYFKARSARLTMNNGESIGSVNFRSLANCDIISLHSPNFDANTSATLAFNQYSSKFSGTPAKPFYYSEPVPQYAGETSYQTALTRHMWGTACGGSGIAVQNDCSFGWDPNTLMAGQASARNLMYDREGHCCRFFNQSDVDFGSMTPQGSLSSTGVCLANAIHEYVVFTQSQSFTLNLGSTTGTSSCRFYSPRTGQFQATFYKSGGGTQSFTAPDTSDWVLHVKVTGEDTEAPSVPTNVQASALSSSSIQVAWTASTDNAGVAGYNVFRNGGQVGTSTSTNYTDTGLAAETTYSYTISAYDYASNNSAQSSPPATATTLTQDTTPPSVPTGVTATAQSPFSIQVAWTASTDNRGVTGYKIFRNATQVATSPTNSYTDNGLTPNTTYSYTVSAYDADGNESAQSSPPATSATPEQTGPLFCSVDLGTTDVNNLLSRVSNSDGYTLVTTAGGLNCRKPQSTSTRYMYFGVDDTYIYNTDETVFLEVSYYDDQAADQYLLPEYDSTYTNDEYGAGGKYKQAGPVVYFTNTGKWITATWTLEHAKFANRQNSGADFRIFYGSTGNVKIDSVRISRIPYNQHQSVERDLGSSEAYLGLSHPQCSDGDTVVASVGGKEGRKCSAAGDNYFYFNVSDAVIYNGSCPTVYLKVEYYDSPGGEIRPDYDSTSDPNAPAAVVTFTGSNTWKEAVWTLTDVKFANSENVSSDFRLWVGTGYNVYINKVTVSRAPFGDTTAPSVPTSVQAVAQTPSTIKVTWAASNDNVGVTGYKVYRNGAQVGTATGVTYTDGNLASNTTYSYTVSAYDAAANNSAQSSPPATATTFAAISIMAAKTLGDGPTVGLVSKTVTAVFSDCFYIEESDRCAGMRVVPTEMPTGLGPGDLIDVGGTLQTVAGERRIGNAGCQPMGSAPTPVLPLALTNRALGGGNWLYNQPTGAGQKGIKDAFGANNIGLLVETWGRFTKLSDTTFEVDDGSGAVVRCSVTGVTLEPTWQYVAVKGISSCYVDGTDLRRFVLARGEGDISPIP